MDNDRKFPEQRIPYKKKGNEWRRRHLDWAEANISPSLNSGVASTLRNMRINYDLVGGKIHMDDIMLVLDPSGLNKAYVPDTLQHYPVMNGKLEVLRGEEVARRFEWHVVCTNMNAISDIERKKTDELYQVLQDAVREGAKDENEFRAKLQAIDTEFRYDWQDQREIRANALLNHYTKEINIDNLFAAGFMDAMTVGNEIYICKIEGGEPIVERLNPTRLHCWRSGQSSRVEDADVLVYEDWWSLGRIYDAFHDKLTEEDMKYLEGVSGEYQGAEDYTDETLKFVNADTAGYNDGVVSGDYLFGGGKGGDMTDADGNIRIIHMMWKSRRQVKRLKKYNQETGEAEYSFVSEDYIEDKDAGEETAIYWVNEAWEGYKIGRDVYVGIGPCELQFNTMENPSKCHFGIIGSFYNINKDRVLSLVDVLKPFQYLYDVVHERLNEAMSSHIGQVYELDLASLPENWTPDQFMFYLRKKHIAVKDSFKEGNYGAATGKIAGAYAANSRGVIGNDNSTTMQQHEQILGFIMDEMSKACGITPQREGMVQNRETVGGVERATLQSSYITEWLFNTHEDVKRRVLECYLEVIKYSMKGKNKKFQHILSDGSVAITEIEGDEFCENDYGLVVDSSPFTQQLNAKLGAITDAAMMNNMISLSSVMRLFTSTSLSQSIRMIQVEEEERMRQAQEESQRQQQMQQAQLEQQMQIEQARLEAEERKSIRDAETKIEVARIQAEGRIAAEREYGEAFINEEVEAARIEEQAREFDSKEKADADQAEKDRAVEREKMRNEYSLKSRELEIRKKEAEAKAKQATTKKSGE